MQSQPISEVIFWWRRNLATESKIDKILIAVPSKFPKYEDMLNVSQIAPKLGDLAIVLFLAKTPPCSAFNVPTSCNRWYSHLLALQIDSLMQYRVHAYNYASGNLQSPT